MVEIIERQVKLAADFINKLFLYQVEFEYTGDWIPVGKIVTAFLFFIFSLYFILDAMGVLDEGE